MKTPRGEIAVDVRGEGPPVLLSSGLGGTASSWHRVAPILQKQFKIITYDQLGTGRSVPAAEDDSVALMAGDAAAILQQICSEPVAIIGHALGAAIAMEIVTRALHPVRGLALVSAFAKPDVYMTRCLGLRRKLLADGHVDAFCEAAPLFLFPGWWINRNSHAVQESVSRAIASFPEHSSVLRRIDSLLSFDISKRVADIATPTIVIASDNDGFTNSETSAALAKAIPGCTFALLPDGGHMAPELFPEELSELLIPFLINSFSQR